MSTNVSVSCLRRTPAVRALCTAVFALLFFAAIPPAHAQVSGVSYTLSPVGQYSFFEREDATGLNNGFLYGGELGFGFGRYLEVSALYQQGDDFEVGFDDAGDDLSALEGLAPDRDVDLQKYGGRVRVNLGNYSGGEGGFAPYLSGGAGILRFDPAGVDESESIYLNAGVGVTLSAFNRYTLTVEGQGLAYRYNPATTFFTSDELDGITTGQEEVFFVPSVRAGLQFYLGGRDPDEITALDRALQDQFSGGLGNLDLFVEPFYGRVEFASELKGDGDGQFYRDQNLAGVNAGIELGPYVGLRGFYWRGASGQDDIRDDFAEEFQPIALYGGELNLRFGGSGLGSRSFIPYGIIGGGYVNVLSDYDDKVDPVSDGQSTPDDRYFGTLGGGVEVPLSDALSLQGGVRSLFMSSQEAEDISTPDEVYANLMYSAGVKFSLGGVGDGPSTEELLEARAADRERALRDQTRTDLDESQRTLLEEIRQLQMRIDSLEQRDRRGQRARFERDDEDLTEEEVREILREERGQEGGQRMRQQREQQQRSSGGGRGISDRVIELPVPEVGEIYVRIGENAGGGGAPSVETSYAPPVILPQTGGVAAQQQGGAGGGLSRDEIASIVQQEVRRASEGGALSRDEIAQVVEQTVSRELAVAGDEDVNVAARNAQIRQLEERISDLRDDLEGELEDFEDRQRRLAQGDDAPQVVIEEESDEEGTTTRTTTTTSGIGSSPYTPSRIVPMAGFAFGGDGRFLIGARGDYGGDYSGVGSGAGFRFMPEAAIGFGDGVGLNLLANGVYGLSDDLIGRYLPVDNLSPYVGAGLGITTETGFGINLLGGAEYQTDQGALFLEYSTVGFFDYNRVLVGLRTRF